jgi:biotin-(acetyl-CoA carboxylase) ligase
VRAATAETGPLSDGERSAFAARDVAAGRRCIEPVVGRVRGIAADGALLVERDDGRTDAVRAGSLILQPEENAS